MKKLFLGILALALSTFAIAQQSPAAATPADLPQLQKMMARFAPTPYRVPVAQLSAGDRQALVKLIEAARVIDNIFLQQYWSGNEAEYAKLQQDPSALGVARLQYFWNNKGPWSVLDENKAFLPDVPAAKLPGGSYYPEDMTKDEFNAWLKTLPREQQDEATGFFTVIRRNAQGQLSIVPYNEAYKADLEKAARLLHEAAALTTNASLKKFLDTRADAFLSNDYRPSDVAWMDLDAPIDVTIGPYETYSDEIFSYKAAFEAYISIRDDKESTKLARFSSHLQELENNLPEDAQYRSAKLGALSPIRVVDEIYGGGEGDQAVQTAAYNLPNDDVVVKEKGSKRVMLKNVQDAKFEQVLVPIGRRLLARGDQKDVDFDSFFTHILMHELTHGLGPHEITVNGRTTNPRLEIKELYSAIEEAKADVGGLWNLQYLLDHGQSGLEVAGKNGKKTAERRLYTTYLASAFRSLRFGVQEAHGKGMAVQFNFFVDHGAFVAHPDGTYSVDVEKMKAAVRDLAHDLLTLEATGDYAGAQKLLATGVIRPELQKALDRLNGIPVDIQPVFTTAYNIDPAAKAPGAPTRAAEWAGKPAASAHPRNARAKRNKK